MVPSGEEHLLLIGLTTGERVSAESGFIPVFVPNPVTGRLYLVNAADVRETTLGTDEAFKILIGSGNYIPSTLDPATQALYGSSSRRKSGGSGHPSTAATARMTSASATAISPSAATQ